MITLIKEDWTKTEIGEIVDIHDHKRIPISGKERVKRQGTYPYYGASGIIDYIDDYIFNGRYLLIAEDGENLNSRKLPIAFFANGKFWVNNHAHIVKGKSGVADDYFIQAWFAQANISGYITGAAQPKLSQSNLKRIELNLPPLPTQRKIASILSAYDDLIENNLRRIKILEEMAQNLYREWFVKFLFPGHESVRFVDSPLGRIPEGWEVTSLKDLAEITYGHPFKSKEFNVNGDGLGAVRIRDIRSGKVSTYTTEEGKPKHLIDNGDILVGMDGQFHIGKWTGGVAWLVQRVARFRPKNHMGRYFLFLSIEKPIKHLENTIVGTTVGHLSAKDLNSMYILVPSKKLLNMVNSIFEPMYNLEMRLRFRNTNLRQTRDLLLPKLISGEVDVSELDIETQEEMVT